jgi:hypothetical protein
MEFLDQLRDASVRGGLGRWTFLANARLGAAHAASEQWRPAEAAFSAAAAYLDGIRKGLPESTRPAFQNGEHILGMKNSDVYDGLCRVRENIGPETQKE